MQQHQEHFYRGVSYMLASAMCVTVTCALGKLISESVSLYLLLFIRFFVPLLLVLWVFLTMSEEPLCLKHVHIHAMRALFVVAGQYCLFYFLQKGSVLSGSLLYSTGPIFVPLVARLSHGAPCTPKTWVSILISFLGVLCLIGPDRSLFQWSALIGLGAGLFNACSQVAFHSVSKSQSPLMVSLYMYFFSSVLCYLPWHSGWVDPAGHGHLNYLVDSDLLLIFIAFSVASISNQMFRSKAYRQVTQAATIAPFMYATIVFSGLIDWLVHHHVPDLWTIGGVIGIVAGGLCMRLLPEDFHVWIKKPIE